MDLVLIHGRAQEGKKTEAIVEQWLGGLKESFQTAGLAFPSFGDIRLPYYGDMLAELTYDRPATTANVAHRGLEPDEAFDPFVAEFVKQMARRDGLSEQEVVDVLVAEGLTTAERGPKEWAWVHMLARHLEARHPWLRDRVLQRIVADVKAYIDRPDVRDAVHGIVEPAIGNQPCIVIAHSLGTVVAYWVLAKLLRDTACVPLFITAGSPLGLQSIKTGIVPPPRNFPEGVEKWINLTDKRDIVALTETLDEQTFLANIENITDLHNGDDPHSIARYLADARVAKAIHSAMGVVT